MDKYYEAHKNKPSSFVHNDYKITGTFPCNEVRSTENKVFLVKY